MRSFIGPIFGCFLNLPLNRKYHKDFVAVYLRGVLCVFFSHVQ